MASSITFIPKAIVHPDRIILLNEVKREGTKHVYTQDVEQMEDIDRVYQAFIKSTRKNNGFLSTHAKRKLFRALDYLILMSDRKKVYSKLQQKYISFKVVFVTLTLPAEQIHSDKEITNLCFNQLLVELSKYHNVKRYVWRAEKQDNGNIHYHLLINQFIEYQELRKRWNRIVNKLGYVDRYQQSQKEFFKNGFRMSENPNDKRTRKEQIRAYIIGQKSDWRSPNSTDIHDTRKIKDAKKYVSKYMSKQPDIDLESSDLESEKLIVKSRLWSCSHDLSNVKGCEVLESWDISDELEQVAAGSKCRVYSDTYFKVMYCSIQDVLRHGTGLLFKYFSDYLITEFNYSLQTEMTQA